MQHQFDVAVRLDAGIVDQVVPLPEGRELSQQDGRLGDRPAGVQATLVTQALGQCGRSAQALGCSVAPGGGVRGVAVSRGVKRAGQWGDLWIA